MWATRPVYSILINLKCGLDRVPFGTEQDAAIPYKRKGITQTFLLAHQPEASHSWASAPTNRLDPPGALRWALVLKA
jgi:hypothetical protein